MSNSYRRFVVLLLILLGTAPVCVAQTTTPVSLTGRVPAVPLVAHDPYFSIWSTTDRLTDAATRHWTGTEHALSGLVRIDGKAFRFCGAAPDTVPALPQISNEITPTRTIYTFEGEGVRLKVAFLTPSLPDDIEVLSRPVTYLSFEPSSLDGKRHKVAVYFDAAPQIAVNTPEQEVKAERADAKGLDAVRVGTTQQPILQKKGDNLRIDWGYAYLAAPEASSRNAWARRAVNKLIASGILTGQLTTIAPSSARAEFAASGNFPVEDAAPTPAPANAAPVLAALCDFGEVGAKTKAQHLLLAYDDIRSIMLMNRKLPPFWRRGGMDVAKLLQTAEKEMQSLEKRSIAFDAELMRDAQNVGGDSYARLITLSYRQALAAHKIAADERGRALHFSKENFSNGCIATVDVTYPAAPFFLLLNPELLKGQLIPVLDYAASPRWKFPFAPHDLGTYPKANGQVYGGGERTEENQMPVEETGNMLIMLAALSRVEGNADFAKPYFPVLDKWAAYLKDKGLDPENQLCTDDFAGHLAHNTNLSLKAIVALGGYAMLCDYAGRPADAKMYRAAAEEMAKKWAPMADDGTHFRLAFDRPGTWSQKYNIVWDKLLDMKLFSPEIARRELAFYATKINTYGLPLDNRRGYTKLDWCVWTATLSNDKAEFQRHIAPLEKFMRETPSRVPMTDWYETGNARQSGFQARSVVGGTFIKFLDDAALWKKWAARGGKVKLLPAAQIVTVEIKNVVPTAQENPNIVWSYTTTKPAAGWEQPTFTATGWQTGKGGFGEPTTPGALVNTRWKSDDIWVRRSFTLSAEHLTPEARRELMLWMHHDEDAEVYINGVLAGTFGAWSTDYEEFPIAPAAQAALKPGENVLAIHVRQTGGGQYIDAGLVRHSERTGK